MRFSTASLTSEDSHERGSSSAVIGPGTGTLAKLDPQRAVGRASARWGSAGSAQHGQVAGLFLIGVIMCSER